MRRLFFLLLVSIPATSALIPIESYTMPNGESNYLDTTYNAFGQPNQPLSLLTLGKGKLTDGKTGVNDWTADLGNGPSFEWVGWLSIDPTITIQLAQTYRLDTLRIHANDSSIGGVKRFIWANVAFSENGNVFSHPVSDNISHPNRFDPDPDGFFSIPLEGRAARAIKVRLSEWGPYWTLDSQGNYVGTAYPWIFVSEIQVTSVDNPEPRSIGLIALGLGALVLRRKRAAR
jgi:hypothetical protein